MQEKLFYLKNVRCRDGLTYPELSFKANALNFLTGKSGCGKSTLLQLLNGTLDYSEGTVLYRNREIKTFPPLELRREIILVPQKIFLFPESIYGNFRRFYSLLDKECPSEEKIAELTARFGLNKNTADSCAELSGGEKQRVYLAVCLSLAPKVLLLDEPTSALDSANAANFMEILREIKKDCSVVMVCHDEKLFCHADSRIDLGA